MFVLFDLTFILFSVLYLPYFILKRKYNKDFVQRLGIFRDNLFQKIKNRKVIWIHAVSVGEVNAALPLWKALREKFPQYKIVFSTVTKTGNRLAAKLSQSDELVIYSPLDLSLVVRNVIKLINPKLLIILETELWPNFILQCKKEGIPVVLVNARISDASYGRYKLAKPLLSPILRKVDLTLAQTGDDARRMISLGMSRDKVKVTGNMKFDNIDCSDKSTDYNDKLRLLLGLSKQNKLLVAGSTHRGEEEIILGAYRELLKEFPGLKLLIAPRHPERTPEIERIITQNNFTPLRVSCLEYQSSVISYQLPIFILDTIGQLRDFYAISSIVFMGGSLVKRGGHNIIEPAIFSKPIISGRYFFNFADIFRLLLKGGAILICQNKEDFKQKVKNLLSNQAEARDLGSRAQQVVTRSRGAVSNNLEFIKSFLS
ncbi:MAG: 3-deoxy-D-manno-octulosonic acid transferase [Candidatus Omnitrophica bacterium]|nr:3-deoxy-D-manno-octulosonic acid transferase [Candidatus Omnitrophota bacterium]